MNRQELITRTLLLEQVAAEARARAAKLREQLAGAALAELAEQGTAPTWKVKDVGTVWLPTSTETVYVADAGTFTAWVKARRPDEVETLHRVRPAFVGALLDAVAHDQERVFVPSVESSPVDVFADLSGEVVDGLSVRPGGVPGTLTFKPDKAAQAVARAGAEKLVDDLERALDGPVVLAEPRDG